MAVLDDLLARSGGVCEFCGSDEGLELSDVGGTEEAILICATCRTAEAGDPHWRCLEGAVWSGVEAVQIAVWRKLGGLDAAWAVEAREGMMLEPEVLARAQAGLPVEGVIHRDSNGTVLAAGDTVTLIKDLPVKGAGFTAKRGTAVRGISLVAENAGHIEGRVEGQRIVILTEFVKKR
ncbi:PhnA domain-containing protein [Albirhodobacter sp. R86504]|uniref:PhnA domain-containing protein n=1 Tax=Albirhodobacter sp. R86504 TaxID=3093848 RepID=UPI00366B9A22